MRRIGLLVADILVTLLLLFSFILLFLYPPRYTPPVPSPKRTTPQIVSPEHHESNGSIPIILEGNTSLSMLAEMNATEGNESGLMSLEEILRLSQEAAMQEYLTKQTYIYTPLDERLKATGAQKGDPVYLRIFKSEAILEVWIEVEGEYKHLKDYPICAFSGHLGPKLKEGDRQSPEGFYRVYKRQLNPHSRFHLAFNLGYPNAYDRAHHRTGSYLMVHGDCRSVGCYAMTDKKIEEIYALVASALRHGQRYVPVHIFPFRMEDETMARYTHYRWYDFWTKLKEGYDYFQVEGRPPRVDVVGGEYEITEAEE